MPPSTEKKIRVVVAKPGLDGHDRGAKIIAEETGVANTIDPLAGSYFLEALTDRLEEQAYQYFAKIDELGGMVEAIKMGYPQREIADAALTYQREVEAGTRRLVGVNAYTEGGDEDTPILRIDPDFEPDQIRRVQAVREGREPTRLSAALEALERAARDPGQNLMPHLLEAARAEATEGEMVQTLQRVFGTYTELPAF